MDSPQNRRNVIVSGASRGLGLGIAKKLAANGYRVIALARKESDEARALAGDAFRFIPFDLADIEAIPELVRGIKAEHGALYGLVNNAALGTEGLLSNMHNSQIETLIRVNTLSPIVLTKYVVRSMMTAGEGRIVNIASIIGATGYSGLSVYGATKASMIGFTRSLAREVGRLGVTVNAIAPGFIDTQMTSGMSPAERDKIANRSALRRLAEVEDVANAALYLLGDGGRNITGTVMTVDAGNTA
ncbi:MAG TPA: SDR family NAD(P)-dependent oxidoreductase [Rhizomicrobium sp.]